MKSKVLVLLPLGKDYLAIENLPKSIANKHEFFILDSEHFSHSSRASEQFSLVSFIDKACKTVDELGIDIVMSTRDVADLVHAVLCTKFPHIKGCRHYISSFVALYKPYTRKILDTIDGGVYNINYKIINVNEYSHQLNSTSLKRDLTHFIATKMKGHGFMKPPAATCSSLVGSFRSADEFLHLLKLHTTHGKIYNHYLPEFVQKYVTSSAADDLKQLQKVNNNNNNNNNNIHNIEFDISSRDISNILLVEQFIDTPVKVTVDGCVVNGNIHTWVVVDSIYWTEIGKNECFIGCCMPSNLGHQVLQMLKRAYERIVGKLIENYGFDNQFIDCEFFVNITNDLMRRKAYQSVANWKLLQPKDVEIKLMEVNARSFMQMRPVYANMFENAAVTGSGDVVATLLKIGARDDADGVDRVEGGADKFSFSPKLIKGKCGLNGYLNTFGSGKSEDLFDFEKARKWVEKGVVVLAVEKGQIIETVSEQGTLLAYANVFAADYEKCKDQLVQIGKELVKVGGPWEFEKKIFTLSGASKL